MDGILENVDLVKRINDLELVYATLSEEIKYKQREKRRIRCVINSIKELQRAQKPFQ